MVRELQGIFPSGCFLFQLWGCPASALAVGAREAVSCGPIRSSGRLLGACSRLCSSPLPLPGVVTTFRFACLGSSIAASTCSGACGRCLRIALGPGADFPFVSLPCGRVVLMGQSLVIVYSPLGGCVSFTPFWLGSVASALSLSESWLFFLLWICRCYCRIQWRCPSRKLFRFP